MKRTALFKAYAALWWERAAPVLWPVAMALGLYAGLALFGLWDAVGDPWRALAALTLAALAGYGAWRAWRSFVPPTGEDAARRIEEDSGIKARPHEALIDRPAAQDAIASAMWQAHRERMAARLSSADARRPKAAWATVDRWGLRISLLLFLIVSIGVAGEFAAGRLGEAFSPRPIYRASGDLTVDAWLDPPAYTGRAPIIIREDMASIEAPEGSTFIVRTAGVGREPSLRLDGDRGETRRIGDGVWESRIPIMTDAVPELRAGGRRQSWRIGVIPDTEPVVRMTEAPEARSSGELVLHFTAEDDYGAIGYAIEFRPRDDSGAEWDRLEIQPSAAAETEDGFRAIVDTGMHRLAGSRVDLRVTATDAADNTGRSPSITLTLPERIFLDSLARSVAEQRREVMSARGEYETMDEPEPLLAGEVPTGPAYMAEDPARRIERAPEGMQRVANALDAITDAPEFFFDDPIVYLGLRRTLHDIRRARDNSEIGPVEENLWEIALRAELGSLADAEAALRAAERALMEALARGADESELAPLFDAYEQAMENYLAALAREAAESGEMAEGGGEGGLNTEDLAELLQALRDAAELGDTADARRALQTLGELLRNLQMQMAQGGSGEGEDAMTEAMREAMEELGDVIGEQRELQDQTFGMTEQGAGMPGQPEGAPQQGQGSGEQAPQGQQQGGGQAQALAQQQGRLAEELAAIAQGFPGAESEEALSGAQQAMRQAQEALEQGDAQGALDAQEDALQALREGAENIAREIQERMAENEGGAEGEEGERDPLGRPGSGSFSSGTGVDIPDEDTRQRARRILEQLRERAAEQGRPQDEIEYYERLLERFGS